MNKMLKAGADKVAVNSSAVANPQLIRECSEKFGNQCVVAAIDARKESDGTWHVYVAGGRKDTGIDLIDWAKKVVSLGAGEILLTSMDKDGHVGEVISVDYGRSQTLEDRGYAFTLTEEEAVRLAAEGICRQTGQDVPLEDPEKYHSFVNRETSPLGWNVNFISHTADWGRCSAFVDDATHEVTSVSADVEEITADNILARYRNQNGWYAEWDTALWEEIARKAANLKADTMEGRVVKATPWIAWREGLLTMEEAEEKAFRGTGVRTGSHNVACLIDSQPNPVWKFWIMEYSGDYRDLVVEVDAVTGEITDLDRFKTQSDWEPYYHTYTLHRTWARMELEENGPLYLAQVAVLHNFADLGLDLPEEWSIPIFNETFWKPEIDGNTVTFRCHWSNLPDYRVTVDADGIPTEVVELPSSGTEELPPDKMPGADLEF